VDTRAPSRVARQTAVARSLIRLPASLHRHLIGLALALGSVRAASMPREIITIQVGQCGNQGMVFALAYRSIDRSTIDRWMVDWCRAQWASSSGANCAPSMVSGTTAFSSRLLSQHLWLIARTCSSIKYVAPTRALICYCVVRVRLCSDLRTPQSDDEQYFPRALLLDLEHRV